MVKFFRSSSGTHIDRAATRSRSVAAPYRSRTALFAQEISISLIFNVIMAGVMTRRLSNDAVAADGRFAPVFIDIALASSGAMMGTVIPVTLAVRRRVRLGQVAPMDGGPLKPENVLLRTLTLCVVTPLVLGLPAAWLLAALALHGAGFLLFKIAYGAVIAVTMTPLVIIAALRDRSIP